MKYVVIFARRPQLGRVKTRLAADIGPVETLRFYKSTLNTVARRLSAGGGWATSIAITPDDTLDRDRLYPPGVWRLPQGEGDLGQRMANCLAQFGLHPALIVGSDIPDIDRRHVRGRFRQAAAERAGFRSVGGRWLLAGRCGAGGARWQPVQRCALVNGTCARRIRWKMCGRACGWRCWSRWRISMTARLTGTGVTVADQSAARCSCRRGISSTKLQGLCRISSW